MITPFKWIGGKSRLVPLLLNNFPKHGIYIEPFGESGVVLINKARSPREIYNDVDQDLVNFFQVVRSKTNCEELCYRLKYTPYSFEENQTAKYRLKKSGFSGVERARLWLLNISFSMFGTGRGFMNDKAQTKRWDKVRNQIPLIHKRLQGVIIENRDVFNIIDIYDQKDALFYMDPPYNPSTQKDKKHEYKEGFTSVHHKRFIEKVLNISGIAIISGYEDPVYIESGLYSKKLKTIKTLCTMKSESRSQVAEYIYSNKPFKFVQESLF